MKRGIVTAVLVFICFILQTSVFELIKLAGFAFLYMVFGFVDGFFNRIYYSDDNILPLVLIGVNDLIYGFIMYILCGLLQNHLQIIYYLKNIILPEMVYTVAVGLVCYQILLRIKSRKKIKQN